MGQRATRDVLCCQVEAFSAAEEADESEDARVGETAQQFDLADKLLPTRMVAGPR